jgi:CPA2 family monovalent cation:H+ antiporter-2
LASEARGGGLINEHIFSLAVSVTILSMFLAPYMVTFARPAARWIVGRFAPENIRPAEPRNTYLRAQGGGVFIIGFGPAGRKVARALLEKGINPHVIELNPSSVKAALKMGLKVHLGDASQTDIISHAGIHGACVIVVTVPDPRSAKRILQNIHALSPESSVIIRSRYHIATEDLWELGAAFVVDEENVVGRELARQVIDFLKDSDPANTECALLVDNKEK